MNKVRLIGLVLIFSICKGSKVDQDCTGSLYDQVKETGGIWENILNNLQIDDLKKFGLVSKDANFVTNKILDIKEIAFDCSKHSDQEFKDFLKKHKNARLLRLKNANDSDINTLKLGELNNLIYLNVGDCDKLTDACVPNLPRSLTSLNLGTRHLKDACIPNLPRSLTSLILERCENLTAACIPNLPPSLTSLTLSFFDNLTDDCILQLPRSLIELNLRYRAVLTDKCIPNLPKSLISLEISGSNGLTDACISQLPRSLIELNLHDCKKLTDACISSLPSELKVLYTNSNINKEKVLKMLPNCEVKDSDTYIATRR